MEINEKITRAKIQIQKNNPFFAYLSLYLKFQEDKTGQIPEHSLGAGVSARGDFIYKKEFVERLTNEELQGVIIHEILHLSLLHLTRRKDRSMEVWNYACDIAVNQLIKDNSITLPDGVVISDGENNIQVGNILLKEVNKKSAEELYEELFTKLEKDKKGKGSGGSGNGKGKASEELEKSRFDKHIENGKGEELTPKEIKEIEDYWKGKIAEAYINAKMKGNIPKGLEVLIGKLHEHKINWRALLFRYITQNLPYDYTWAKPNKKSISAGAYLPDYTKEKINVLVGIDLSGSIGKEELTDFISEIVGIARTFREQISFRLLTHDTEVHNDYEVENGNIDKIKGLKLNGGGGTSHVPIFDYIKENCRDCELSIFLTDGYSDLDKIEMNKFRFKKIFVISNNGISNQIKKSEAQIIHLGVVKNE